MRKLLVVVCVSSFLAITMTSCGSTEPQAGSKPPASNSSTPAATNAAQPASSPQTDSTGSIGVAACDEYLTKMEKCLNAKGVPEAVKDAYRKSFEQYRDSWKKAAADPNGRAALDQGCKAALDGAKAFFDTCK